MLLKIENVNLIYMKMLFAIIYHVPSGNLPDEMLDKITFYQNKFQNFVVCVGI